MSSSKITVSPSPHINNDMSSEKVMYTVVLALLPALLVSLWLFGINALILTTAAILTCLLVEWSITKFLFKKESTISDGSALITGLILAFNLPANLPLYMVVLGGLVAIGIGKMTFGGIGRNPFNPALVGRVFLLACFPAAMTTWPLPKRGNLLGVDGETGATILSLIKEGTKTGKTLPELLPNLPSEQSLFLGNMTGSLGEVSALALILGGIFMLYKKVITWHIPASFIGSLLIFTGIFHLVNPNIYASPIIHLFSGGVILGALFMATDMVTSPMNKKSMVLFGAGCGILTALIRLFGSYPEGVSFAILIMNAVTPLLNKYIKPSRTPLK